MFECLMGWLLALYSFTQSIYYDDKYSESAGQVLGV